MSLIINSFIVPVIYFKRVIIQYADAIERQKMKDLQNGE